MLRESQKKLLLATNVGVVAHRRKIYFSLPVEYTRLSFPTLSPATYLLVFSQGDAHHSINQLAYFLFLSIPPHKNPSAIWWKKWKAFTVFSSVSPSLCHSGRLFSLHWLNEWLWWFVTFFLVFALSIGWGSELLLVWGV